MSKLKKSADKIGIKLGIFSWKAKKEKIQLIMNRTLRKINNLIRTNLMKIGQ